jgi:hypothetical protein
MIDVYKPANMQTVYLQARRSQRSWWVMYLALIGVSVASSVLMLRSQPSPALLVWMLYLAGIVTTFYNPRYGVYLIIGLALFGDGNLTAWYPFTKNLSSRESLLYVSDAVIISPLETYIVLTVLVWLGRMAVERRTQIYFGPMFWVALLFVSFVTYGLGFGLSRGGNLVIALWEARPIYYLFALLVLTSNLIKLQSQVNTLFWIITVSLFFKGITGVVYVATMLQWDMGKVEAIAEHAMSIHFNIFFILMIAAWLYRDSLSRRLLMPLMAYPVFYSYFANHRRAGFLSLGIAVLLIILLLYRENRKLFWALTPSGTLAFMAYLAAFWNNEGSIGMIARAVRSVVGQPTARDTASNVYRDIENLNIMFTISQVSLRGLGFGQRFYIIYQMPDISTFEWWEYITHNSIMWIWMQIGAGGFFAMLLMIAMTMLLGGRLIWTMPYGALRAYALTATLYVLMHFIYAYVDMSWDTRSMLLVGIMMGLLNSLDLIAARSLPASAPRWPWQLAPSGQTPLPRLPAARSPQRQAIRAWPEAENIL